MKHDLRDNKVLHKYRCVAQLGRALRSGRRGRKFKSCRIDLMDIGKVFFSMSFFVPQKARKIKVFQSYTSFVMILSTTFPGLLTI